MARRNRLRKRKYGGQGTRVGNALRRVTRGIGNSGVYQTASDLFRNTRPLLSNLPVIGQTANVIGSVADLVRPNTYNPQPNQSLNAPLNPQGWQAYQFGQQLQQPNLPDSGLFGNAYASRVAGAYQEAGNAVGNNTPQSEEPLMANTGDEPATDPQGRSFEQGVTIPSPSSVGPYGAGGKGEPVSTPIPEFQRGGVSAQASSLGLGSGATGTGGGIRGTGILGTAIDDPVYKGLLEQLEKNSQDGADLTEIRRRNEAQAQREIDAINAIYADVVAQARRTGAENLGSERAINARSGTLGSSFGQDALKRQKNATDSVVAGIEADRAGKIADIYNTSNTNALNEYQMMKNIQAQDFESMMKIKDKQQEILEAGMNDIAGYIALNGVTAEELGIDGLKKIAKDWKTTPERVFNAIKAKEAEIYQTSLDQQEQVNKISGSGAFGGASDFDQRSDELIALSVLPTQLKNSEKEMEFYLEAIRGGLAQGRTPYEVADNLMGYKVIEENTFTDNIRQLIGQSNLAPNKIADVARFINKGEYERALTIVENNVMSEAKKAGDSYISEATVNNAVTRANELNDYLLNNEKALRKIGNVKGSVEKALGRLRGKEGTAIKNRVTQMVAEMRNKLLGSAVTETEERFIRDLIPDLADKPEVFFDKLDRLGIVPLTELNNIRTQYGLVPLDVNTLQDKSARVQAYYQGGQQTQQTQSVLGGGEFSW